MKIKALIIIVCLGLISCDDDFLELKPTTQLSESNEFWGSESGLRTYSNSFYGYINHGKFTDDFNSDNCERFTVLPTIRTANYTIPTALGSGGWSWTNLRRINYFIEKSSESSADELIKNRYLALGRFFRALFYYDKVQRFGDVPWYTSPLETIDEDELYKSRDSRVMVMDKVLEDLDYAIQHLPETKMKNEISRWTALAFKSRICLYEGTWRKYHTYANLSGAERFLTEAENASNQLMSAGVYTLYSTGNPEIDYYNLFQPKDTYTEEVILARSLPEGSNYYYTPLFTSTSNGNYGATRSLVSSYLMRDGESFQDKHPDEEQRDTMSYFDEIQDRDPRFSQSIMYPGYIRPGTTEKTVTDFAQNMTGYAIIKAVGPPIEDQGGGNRDVVVLRYAEVLLNYAEAKAELGTLNQDDVDRTINFIRSRVGMPPLILPAVINPVLASEYNNTSDPTILEIRRERRVELAFEGFRKDDLIRWAEGHRFRRAYEGIYVTGLHKYIDLDNDGNPNVYFYASGDQAPPDQNPQVQYVRLTSLNGLKNGTEGRLVPYFNWTFPEWQDWEYLDPLPLEELTLNPNLTQNSGWDSYY